MCQELLINYSFVNTLIITKIKKKLIPVRTSDVKICSARESTSSGDSSNSLGGLEGPRAGAFLAVGFFAAINI